MAVSYEEPPPQINYRLASGSETSRVALVGLIRCSTEITREFRQLGDVDGDGAN
jgi:hypothetical protein